MNETTDVIGVANCFAKMSVMSSIDFYSVVLTFCKKKCHETWFFVVNFYYSASFLVLSKYLRAWSRSLIICSHHQSIIPKWSLLKKIKIINPTWTDPGTRYSVQHTSIIYTFLIIYCFWKCAIRCHI